MKSKFVKAGLLLMMFVIMTALSACGGGAGGESAGGNEDAGAETEAATVAEPNSGIGDIVYAIPDGWEASVVTAGSYVNYKNSASEYELYTSIMSEESVKDTTYYDAEDKEIEINSIQDYYDKIVVASAETLKKSNIVQEKINICGHDGVYTKRQDANGKNAYFLSTAWVDGDKAYIVGFSRADNWDKGKIKEDAVALTEDEIKMYEAVIASIQKGDGEAFAAQSIKADSIGEFAFVAPENYTAVSSDDRTINFEKNDNENIGITIDRVTEEGLKMYAYSVDDKPIETLDEYYTQFFGDGDETTIAGCEAKIRKYPDENDKYRYVSAVIKTDEAAYEISMGVSDIWDEEGNIKPDAEALSEEDLATFDAFLEGITKK